jgi:hypothetical protein
MSTAYLVFTSRGQSFEDYFRLEGLTPARQAARFAVGLAPAFLSSGYLVDPSRLDLAAKRGPSTPMACELCAGVVGTEALKLLLGRGRVRPAPYFHQFDAFEQRFVSRRRGPLTRLLGRVVEGWLLSLSQVEPAEAPATAESELEQILDLARWAPSGDNAQPWRFELQGEDRLRLFLRDESREDVYDFKGRPSMISGGALLESLRIAASRFGRELRWEYRGQEGAEHTIDVHLPWTFRAEDPLVVALRARATDRRRYRSTPLTGAQKAALEETLGELLDVTWLETRAERWRATRLNMQATDLRMRMPEANQVHKRVLKFDGGASREGIPAASSGMGPLLRRCCRWFLSTPLRTRLMELMPGSTWLAQLQLDMLPGLGCGAQFALRLQDATLAGDPETLLRVGERVQRFWLRATELGLALQPGMAPLLLSAYVRSGESLSADPASRRRAALLAGAFAQVHPRAHATVFLGRIGIPRAPLQCRSLRKPLDQLTEGAPTPVARAPRRRRRRHGAASGIGATQ